MSSAIAHTTIRVTSRPEAAAAIPFILGFHPKESVIVLGVGSGAPSARVDFNAEPVALREIFAIALTAGHWRAGCLVAVFTDSANNAADVVLTEVPQWLPEVPVLDAFRVTAGECFGPWAASGEPVAQLNAPARHIAASRSELVPDAPGLNDAADVLTKAVQSWKAGNGAAAWIYLDRLEELVGGPANLPDRAVALAYLLVSATDPKGIDV